MVNLIVDDLDAKYDPKADAAYISIRRGKHSRTLEVSDTVNVDLDAKGRLLGVELLFLTKTHKEISPLLKKLATTYHAPILRRINPLALTQVYVAA